MTLEDIATAVGKDRATVANFLRLLRLPAEIQAQVSNGALTMGHARALLALPRESDQLHMAHEIIQQGWPVRRTEELVKLYLDPPRPVVQPEQPATPADVHTRAAEEHLRLHLGTRVRIVRKGQKGRIEIDFTSEKELIRIFDQLSGDQAPIG